MELRISEYSMPTTIDFNFEEIKSELSEKVQLYKSLVYSENEIKNAKADKSALNKLKKALDDERKRQEKEYLAPFNVFKNRINELIALIDEPIALIDAQIKAFDENRKNEKRVDILKLFNDTHFPDWVDFEMIQDPRWLNATYSMQQVQDDLSAKAYQILCDMRTLNELPDFGFEAQEEYKRTLDLNKAISEGKRLAEIQKRKNAESAPETVEQIAEAPKAEELRYWIKFEVLVTVDEAKALKAYLKERKIQIR